MEFEDKVINCGDCKNDFDLTADEQEFLFNKVEGKPAREGGVMHYNEPKRCKDCRIKKRERFAGK